jgi:hypothetical protein
MGCYICRSELQRLRWYAGRGVGPGCRTGEGPLGRDGLGCHAYSLMRILCLDRHATIVGVTVASQMGLDSGAMKCDIR